MTCIHQETTTLLWLYGEAEDDHAAHIATCAVCQETVALHSDVLAEVAPILPTLRTPLSVDVAPTPTASNRPWSRWLGAGVAALALVAALLMFIRIPAHNPVKSDTIAQSGATSPASGEPLDADAIDHQLDELDDDLKWLSDDDWMTL